MRSTYVRAAGVAAAVVVAVCVARASAASTAVDGLAADAAVTNTAPSLHWKPLSGAVAYRVVRGGTYLGRITATSFIDSTLSRSGVYTYRVRGVRADGTFTDAAAVEVTYDALAPASITARLGGEHLTNGHPTIVWPTVSDAGPSGIRQYNIRRDGVFIAAVPASRLSFTDTSVGEGRYTYIVRAQDRAGNKAADFSPEDVVTVDTTAPDAPSGVAAAVDSGTVELTWRQSTDGSGIRGYRVLRDGQPVGAVSTTAFTDTPEAGYHTYRVVAVDQAGNESHPSDGAKVSVASAGGSGGGSGSVPTGVSLVTGNDQSAAMKSRWGDAKIISITLRWSQLEPSRGTYDWGNLDASLRDAAARNYKVIVRILCGFNAPGWIYSDPNDRVSGVYMIPTDDGYRLTTGVNVPVPWDPDLLVLYREMMSAVARHLQGSDGHGGTLADHVYMIPVAMATAFGSEMVENFGHGTWAGTYDGRFSSSWNRNDVNTAAWMKVAPSGSTPAEKLASMQRADTQAWISSVDAQESILQPTGVMSSVAYGFAFNSLSTAQAVEAAEVPKYRSRLMTMFTDLQPKVNPNGSLGPWGAWCPACDTLMKAAIADGGPVGFQTAVSKMNTRAKIQYATDSAIATYHPRFIETVGCVINADYGYFFTGNPNVQEQLAALAGG